LDDFAAGDFNFGVVDVDFDLVVCCFCFCLRILAKASLNSGLSLNESPTLNNLPSLVSFFKAMLMRAGDALWSCDLMAARETPRFDPLTRKSTTVFSTFTCDADDFVGFVDVDVGDVDDGNGDGDRENEERREEEETEDGEGDANRTGERRDRADRCKDEASSSRVETRAGDVGV